MATMDSADGHMRRRILSEQLLIFFGQAKDAVIGHTLLGLAVVALLYDKPVDRTALLAWGAAVLLMAAARLVMYRRFPDALPDPADAGTWARRFVVISLVSGAIFGLLPVLFLDGSQLEVTAWILVVLTGLAGGALGTLSAYAPAFRAYILAATVPLIGVLIHNWQFDLAIVACLCVMMILYFMRFSRRFEAALVGQIRRGLENIDLADRLARQGAILNSVIQAIPNAVAVIDREGVFLYHNDQLQRTFELPETLLDGTLTSTAFNEFRRQRGDFEHVAADEFREQLRSWERLSEPGEAFGYDRTLRDGRILRVSNRPLADGGWVRSWIDITEMKRAEAETERKSALLQLTLDHIDQGLALIDADGRQVMVNRRYCELLDLPEEYQHRSVPLREIVSLQEARGELGDIPPETNAMLDLWESGGVATRTVSYERRQRNGGWLFVWCCRLPDGSHLRTYTDITERKLAERQAAERRELLESTLQNIDQGVIMRDADDNILVFNERLAALLDVPVDLYRGNASSVELNAYHDSQAHQIDPDDHARVDAWIARRKAGLPVDRLEYQRKAVDGRSLHVVFQALPDGREIRTFSDVTSIKTAEQEVVEKTRFLEAVLGAMEQGVLVTDPDTRILLWNHRVCEILALPAAALEAGTDGRSLWRLQQDNGDLDPSDPAIAAYIQAWRDWQANGTVDDIFSFERPLPGDRGVLIYGRKLPDGKVVRTFTDLTDQRRTQAELLRAKEEADLARQRLRVAMDAMPAGVVIMDEALNYQVWNDTYKDMTGLTDAEIARLRSVDRIIEFKRNEVLRSTGGDFDGYVANRKAQYRGDRPSVVTEHWSSTGRHVELRISPIPTGGWVSIYLDMTQRINAEQEIAETSRRIQVALDSAEVTRERMRAILQSIPVGVLVYDAEQKVEFWNSAYCAFTGFPSSVLEGKPHFTEYSKFIFDNHNRGKDMSFDQFMTYRDGVYQSDEYYVREFFFDKTGLDVQYTVSSLGEGGRVNVIVDITPQKQAQRAAIEARDLAEEATRAKSDFLAAMSHEIRTPMNGVLGVAEVLAHSNLDHDQQVLTRTIQDSGNALLRIIDDILDFSKIEAGWMALEPEPVGPRTLAEGVLDTLAQAADAKDLDLALMVQRTTPAAVLCDPVRVRQILLNLVGNAIKFTNEGSVLVHVSGTPDRDDGSLVRVRFEVIDTGIGVAPDRIEQLFQPFRQAEASTTRQFGGTGLGLSICRRLVSMMNGDLGVDSNLGDGARFWFEIPVEAAAADEPTASDGRALAGLHVLTDLRPGPTGDTVAAELEGCGMVVTGGPTPATADGDKGGAVDVVVADHRGGAAVPAASEPDGTPARGRRLWVRHGRDPARPAVAVPVPVRRESLLRAIARVLDRALPTPAPAGNVDAALDGVIPSVEQAIADHRLVLVAEDHPTNRMLVLRQLGMLGYAAETAVDGREAFAMWRTGRYSLLLTDCNMPAMDGYQLATAIRAAEQATGRHTPIVALTANALVTEQQRCLAAGMDGYLTKPVKLDTMQHTLRRWLGSDATAGIGPAYDSAEDGGAAVDPEGPIDIELLGRILGDTAPEFVSAILGMFREAFEDAMTRLDAAVRAHDAPELREAAHAAKGAAANAAAVRLQAALDALEHAAGAADWDTIPGLLDEVDDRRREVLDYIDNTAAR